MYDCTLNVDNNTEIIIFNIIRVALRNYVLLFITYNIVSVVQQLFCCAMLLHSRIVSSYGSCRLECEFKNIRFSTH